MYFIRIYSMALKTWFICKHLVFIYCRDNNLFFFVSKFNIVHVFFCVGCCVMSPEISSTPDPEV